MAGREKTVYLSVGQARKARLEKRCRSYSFEKRAVERSPDEFRVLWSSLALVRGGRGLIGNVLVVTRFLGNDLLDRRSSRNGRPV